LTQLEFQIDKILEAFYTLVTGKLPLYLLSPDVLHNILTNVTLSLPEGSNLIVGSRYADLPWYYQNVKAALLADVNSFLLVISFPLTAVNRNYEIYKVVAFPFKIVNNTYLRYKFDSGYLAINILQKAYLAMSENVWNNVKDNQLRYVQLTRR